MCPKLASSAIVGCSRWSHFWFDILLMLWMPPRKVFLNLVMQREGYMAVWYVLVLSCDSCHDNKSHVHFLEWMVCLQTYKECYQIWQVWNDDMPGNPGAWAEWMLRLASQNLLLVRSGRKTDAPSGFVSCFSVLFFFLIWFGVFWRVTWEFQTEFVRWTEEKKKAYVAFVQSLERSLCFEFFQCF